MTRKHARSSSLLLSPLYMTATEEMEAKAELAASTAGLIKEARRKMAVTFAVSSGTALYLKYVVQTLAHRGNQPALLVLELSTWLSFLLYLWAVYVTRVLAMDNRRLGVRALLTVLVLIFCAVAASMLVSAVVGMVLMYLVSLCVAGFFAWCLGDYLRTRDSAESASTSAPCQQENTVTTSAPDESQEALLQKKSSSKPNLTHEHHAGDLEAGLSGA